MQLLVTSLGFLGDASVLGFLGDASVLGFLGDASVLGFLGDALGLVNLYDRVMVQARRFPPEQVGEVIDRYVYGLLTSRSTAFLTIGLLGALWGAAGGVCTLIKGLNRAYDVERSRPF